MKPKLDLKKTQNIIIQALREDLVGHDITTETVLSLISSKRTSPCPLPKGERITKAVIEVKKDGIVAGIDVAKQVFKLCGNSSFMAKVKDGARVKKGQIIAEIKAPIKIILIGERAALNFLQHLSGIATLTAEYVEKVKRVCKNKKCPAILDTRKTIPGLRYLEKYAVRCGGGQNHRLNLSDMVLFKDNHWKIIDSQHVSLAEIKKRVPNNIKLEIEAENMTQLKQALEVNADYIMLDNMTVAELKRAIKFIRQHKCNKPQIELSGGINLGNIGQLAKLGADRISLSKITQSAPALDMSLEIVG